MYIYTVQTTVENNGKDDIRKQRMQAGTNRDCRLFLTAEIREGFMGDRDF